MLDSLQVRGFKCFDKVEIELRNINVFSGTNSSGKSTAIQALLLLCNNVSLNTTSPLNGMWLRLGTFEECRNRQINAREFQIGVKSANETFTINVKPVDDTTTDVAITSTERSEIIENLLSFDKRHVFYLPANRIGPEDSYPKNFDRVNFLGNKAEFIIDFLFKNRKTEVYDALIADNASVTLEYQVNYWLTKLFNIKNTISDLGLSNSLSVDFTMDGGACVRPYHMGTGVSFALGVIVTCLSARPNDVIIIENPEIHLHPKAQSDLTAFLCFIANAGIQIILETHSDHIFNGIRKAIVKKEITCDKTMIHFFQLDKDLNAFTTPVAINEHGRVVTNVKGLFDQFDDDLDQIIGI
ncbi:MAG: DUF3696 domain-containing protein [Fibrobacter sp.]|nr:DUF3696 domain-containing protein [Fibrobacter sp.]